VKAGALDAFHRELAEHDDAESLAYRLARLFLDALRPSRRPADSSPIEERFDDLIDDLVRSGSFGAVRRLVGLLNGYASRSHHPAEAELAHDMRARIGRSRNVALALRATEEDAEAADLLASLGAYAVPGLLDVVDSAEDPAVRTLAIEQLVACSPNPGKVLAHKVAAARPEIARSILESSSSLSDRDRSRLIFAALDHASAETRIRAVQLIEGCEGAEEPIHAKLHDDDVDVRLAALSAVRVGHVESALPILAARIELPSLASMSEVERTTTLEVYATVAGSAAVKRLAGVIAAFGIGKVDARIAAVRALGMIGTRESVRALERGARSLIPRVRAACQAALEPGDSPTLPVGYRVPAHAHRVRRPLGRREVSDVA
jgi:hypothetical protein